MPIHDWTKVKPALFHDFHYLWIAELRRAFAQGVLPKGFEARVEQPHEGFEVDILAAEQASRGPYAPIEGGVSVLTRAPRVRHHIQSHPNAYAPKARRIAIRRTGEERVVAVIEIVSPGNKDSTRRYKEFVEKCQTLILSGVHLGVFDLLPPKRGIGNLHPDIWSYFHMDAPEPTDEEPLLFASYIATEYPQVYLQPARVGVELPEMPLFLTDDVFVELPLEETYMAAFSLISDDIKAAVGG